MAEETKTESVDEMLQTLQLLLLRVHVILEAADGQSITSQAMLQQLNILKEGDVQGLLRPGLFQRKPSQPRRCQRSEQRDPLLPSPNSVLPSVFFSLPALLVHHA